MANQSPSNATTVSGTLRSAFAVWVVLVVIGAGGIGTVVALTPTGGRTDMGPMFWFAAIVFGVGIPAAWRLHVQCFRRYWRDGLVTPAGYWRASLILWGVTTASIVVSCLSALVRQVFIPDLLLAAFAMMMLVLSFPSGWAMTHRTPREEEDDEQDLLHLPHEP